MSYFAPPRPRVFGHRGAAGLAPENTLPSFALAAALGAGYLELDVHATRDGNVVVVHDPTLDRTTDGSGPVAELTFAELAGIDAGYRFTADGRSFPYRGQGIRIPTLDSVLRRFPEHRFNIEIKQARPAIVERVVEIIERTNTAGRVLLAAEQDAIMQSIRSVVGGRIATGSSAGEVAAFVRPLLRGEQEAEKPPGNALQIPVRFGDIDLVTAASVAAAHRLGCEVHVWTINEPAEIDRLLALGVDGIMSDFPGLVAAAVERARRPTKIDLPRRRP
jgi:glycerophosphoryl diester phosphodiesterase